MSVRSEWKSSVLRRFEVGSNCYQCIGCPLMRTLSYDLTTIHHIRPKSEFLESCHDPDNGITVCSGLHETFHEHNDLSVHGRMLKSLLEQYTGFSLLEVWRTLHIVGDCYKFYGEHLEKNSRRKKKKKERRRKKN